MLALLLLAVGCKDAALDDSGLPLAAVEAGEWLPGGDATNTLLMGSNAYLMPAANLDPEHEQMFYSGNSFFNQSWVEAPASTANRDGLGPLFNARSCSGCHLKDGRAAPPEDGVGPFVGLLLRLSVPGEPAPAPDPVYGGQLQDIALPGVTVEAVPSITWAEAPGAYPDGAAYSLAAPTYHLDEPGYGPLPDDLRVSPRVAPAMIGLGLLEAIPEARLAALEDPDDADGDGISGRRQAAVDVLTGEAVTGRFGWKAEQPTVAQQAAGAFAGDLGVTSTLFPADDCTPAQACPPESSGGDPEIEDHLLERVVLYSRAVAVPARRAWDDETVLRGKWLFGEVGCDGCHTPNHTTGDFAALPELGGQSIWPYTDLLLHDMGEGLSDERPSGVAEGREWRTAPLWGLGLVPTVNGHSRYLHDGRARSLEEAILWHGGEAEAARDDFMALSAADRDAVLVFLEDL
ncbi:MAG: thiol oxidoreductase [Alphaproteobacteria bacterium]|nr:thiol oxidoreductase [Alphaproteobacteria bacterium]